MSITIFRRLFDARRPSEPWCLSTLRRPSVFRRRSDCRRLSLLWRLPIFQRPFIFRSQSESRRLHLFGCLFAYRSLTTGALTCLIFFAWPLAGWGEVSHQHDHPMPGTGQGTSLQQVGGQGEGIHHPDHAVAAGEPGASLLQPRGQTQYVCPMHPQIVQNEPGTCPICGMDLVARAGEAPPVGYPEVRLDGALMQNLGLRTARVERGNLWEPVRALGRVQYDETRIAHLHPRASGWITRLAVRAEGETVTQGQTLAEFYSPDILAAQIDFLLALGHSSPARGGPTGAGGGASGGQVGVKADKARNLLRLLDVPETVIDGIQTSRETRDTIPIPAPITGVVTGLTAREGMYVTPDSTMFTLVDNRRVWVRVDVFEHQIAGLEPGQTAQMRVPAYPGRTWEGELDYLYPELDPKTRTLPVRLVFDNPDGALRPNLFAEVSIEGEGRRNVLKIPREALIHTGERESVVLALGEGRFQPVDVTTGARLGGEVEILAGLKEGDEVVVSGQFLIDSESSLRASFQRLTSAGGAEEVARGGSGADKAPGDAGRTSGQEVDHAHHHH